MVQDGHTDVYQHSGMMHPGGVELVNGLTGRSKTTGAQGALWGLLLCGDVKLPWARLMAQVRRHYVSRVVLQTATGCVRLTTVHSLDQGFCMLLHSMTGGTAPGLLGGPEQQQTLGHAGGVRAAGVPLLTEPGVVSLMLRLLGLPPI